MPKKVLCAFPPAMLKEIDYVAQREYRTRTGLIHEAMRRYLDAFKEKHGPVDGITTDAQAAS